MLKLTYTFGHVLTVNSRCYGHCYVKKLVRTTAYFPLISYSPRGKCGKLVSKCFYQVFKGLKSCIFFFFKADFFPELGYILGYLPP